MYTLFVILLRYLILNINYLILGKENKAVRFKIIICKPLNIGTT